VQCSVVRWSTLDRAARQYLLSDVVFRWQNSVSPLFTSSPRAGDINSRELLSLHAVSESGEKVHFLEREVAT
jgi:hypothetical protein